MRYSVVNIADGRIVYKSKNYDRYYGVPLDVEIE